MPHAWKQVKNENTHILQSRANLGQTFDLQEQKLITTALPKSRSVYAPHLTLKVQYQKEK
jgi:hypothetical protein